MYNFLERESERQIAIEINEEKVRYIQRRRYRYKEGLREGENS